MSLLPEKVQHLIALQQILAKMMLALVRVEGLQREMEPIVGASAILGLLLPFD
jgi:hypothetical protein